MGFLSVQSIVPPGVVLPFAGSTAPDGWLLCQGQPVNRLQYAALFAAIGTAYGAGDLSSTFNLPDTRGIFLRGAGTNPSNSSNTTTMGNRQLDDFKSHNHLPEGGANNYFIQNGGGTGGSFNWVGTGPNFTRGVNTTSTGGNETRPSNVGVNHIIKV